MSKPEGAPVRALPTTYLEAMGASMQGVRQGIQDMDTATASSTQTCSCGSLRTPTRAALTWKASSIWPCPPWTSCTSCAPAFVVR